MLDVIDCGKFRISGLVDLPYEKWAAIPNFTYYYVSNYGRVRYLKVVEDGFSHRLQIKKENMLIPQVKDGLVAISINDDNGRSRNLNLAKLIAFTFMDVAEIIESGKMIRIEHDNGKRSDCRVSNLIVTAEPCDAHKTRRRKVTAVLDKIGKRDNWFKENMYI